MSIRQVIAPGMLLAAVLVIVAFLLFAPAPPVEQAASTATAAVASHSADSKIREMAPMSPPQAEKNSIVGSASAQNAIDTPEAKDDIFIRINEAMTTYSEEGLPVLTPYLAHSDPEIRDAAVEAIVQLAVPSGAEVLRNAARKAATSEEQIRMLQGAEFLELPRLPLDQLKKMIDDGTVQLPNPAPPSPAAAPTVP